MERRSTRLKDAPRRETPADDDGAVTGDVEMEDEESAPKAKPRARKRKAGNEVQSKGTSSTQPPSKRAKGKRGLLKDVVDMPLDVLFEIFGQLEPVDVLHLARTTKALRSILMSRSSISIWKQAFQNVSIAGLPECPDDMNEPQYADLAFLKTCSFCDRKLAIVHTAWECRVRTCNKCLDIHFSEKSYGFRGSRQYPASLADWLPTLMVEKNTGRRRYGVVKEYGFDDVDLLWRLQYRSQQGADEKAAWMESQIKLQRAIRFHAKTCEQWEEARQEDLKNQKASAVDERKAIVVDRLREMGWGDELDKMPPGSRLPQDSSTVVKHCHKDITERVLQTLEPFLTEFMEEVKSNRIIRDRKKFLESRIIRLKKTYSDYLLTLPADVFYPNTADIFKDSTIKEIINDSTTPELSEEQLDILRAIFPDVLQTWQEPIKAQVVDLISHKAVDNGFSFDPATIIDLAKTIVRCGECSRYISATQSIVHRCLRHPCYSRGVNRDPDMAAVVEAIQEYPWNSNASCYFDTDIVKVMAKCLQMCSFDPETTTVRQLEEEDPIFECLPCNAADKGRFTMRWFGMAQHVCHDHGRYGNSKPVKLIILDEAEAEKVRHRMDEERERNHASAITGSMCVRCRSVKNLLAQLEHVKRDHNIAKPIPGEDVIVSPDSLPCPLSFRFWPPRIGEDMEEMIQDAFKPFAP